MTDAQLAAHLDVPEAAIAGLTPEKRAVFERMHEVEGELSRWLAGEGQRPRGVMIDFPRERRRRPARLR